MSFPIGKIALEKAGYTFSSHAKCRACHAEIEFWNTPKKRWIPLNKDLTAHFGTCPFADRFRSTNSDRQRTKES